MNPKSTRNSAESANFWQIPLSCASFLFASSSKHFEIFVISSSKHFEIFVIFALKHFEVFDKFIIFAIKSESYGRNNI